LTPRPRCSIMKGGERVCGLWEGEKLKISGKKGRGYLPGREFLFQRVGDEVKKIYLSKGLEKGKRSHCGKEGRTCSRFLAEGR